MAARRPRSTAARASASAWLVKTEPSSFSFDDLLRSRGRRTLWTGVRNYQARNFLRQMAVGDLVLVYHSSADPTGIAGLARVARAAAPDPTQFDPKDEHFDPQSPREEPRWDAVEIEALVAARAFVTLAELRAAPRLATLQVLRPGQRLSVLPVTPRELAVVAELAGLPLQGR